MQAIDFAAVLRHAGQTTLQLLRDVADAQYRLSGFFDGIGVFQLMLVIIEVVTTTVEIGYQVSCDGIDQGRQGDFSNHPVGGQKAEEHVLHDILRFDRMPETAADVCQQLITVSNVIIG